MTMPSASGEAGGGTGEQLHDLLAAGLRGQEEDDSAGEGGDEEAIDDGRDEGLCEDEDAGGSGDGEGEEMGPYDPASLPEEHCQFCGVHDPRCLVQCVRTKKWFCNSRLGSGGRGGSCIVIHLVKARLREAEPHPRSPVGGVPFKCHSCGTRNIFVLGLLPAKLVAAMAVVCRVCVTSRGPSLTALDWDVSRWESLIRERVIRQELVPPAPPEARLRMWRPTQRQLLALEELWRENADASLHDLLAAGEGGLAVTDAPGDVLLRYEDAYHYQNVLAPLVELEASEDRRLKEGRRREDLEVTWDKAPQSGRDVLRFRFLAGEEAGHLLEGDELVASLPAGRSERCGFRAWEDKGAVRTASDGSVLLELEGSSSPAPTDVRSGFDVRFVWRDTTFARMQAALRQFALVEQAVSAELRNALLGIAPPPPPAPGAFPPVYRVDGMPMLNGPQVAAVRTALAQPLTLIQGPPGTGKTVTSAMIVWHLVRQGRLDQEAEQAAMDARLRSRSAKGGRARSLRMQAQLRAPRRRVLVAAPSNVAADNLASRIAAAGVRVVRVLARSREQVGTTVEELALHKLALTIDCPRVGTNIDKLASLASRRAAEPGSLSDAEERTFGKLLRAGERAVLEEAEAVCVTCVGAGDPRLKSMRFWALLLDEATQATEPEAIIPTVLGCRRLVLVGDHCQLGPVVQSKPASTAGLTQSLFERLIYLGVQPIRLRVQYRMHPTLAEFPSDTFYEGALQNGVSVADRVGAHDAAISWPVVGQPRAFLTCTAPEELSSSGTSYLNRGEAAAADRVVTRLLRAGVDPFRIGIITPYEGQRVHLEQMLAAGHGQLPTDRYAGLEIASVDSFQGRERRTTSSCPACAPTSARASASSPTLAGST
ncbi:hypothetical protein FNF28_01543 [Cafeteria roenbergensis]|uniref:Upf1 domain-containing protein n=1 Tax=Cafeteria roenbergensis TaxID=33653 RepID=A0A5A8DXR3_CAFRO|nr:hypothetical protein FNF28_01543 [Cafeteria roenbergensis]